ncbi:hypothetical protein KHQ82_06845 [Mycoplasmatota bacterium]|nr:hypothetical protein KHQ82_06845 [Mycoplasmatota bacterium]
MVYSVPRKIYRKFHVKHDDFEIDIPISLDQSNFELSPKIFPDSKELVETIRSYGYDVVDQLPNNLNELFHFNCDKQEVYYLFYKLKYRKMKGFKFTDGELLEILLVEEFPDGLSIVNDDELRKYSIKLYKQFGDRFVNYNFHDLISTFLKANDIVIEDNVARHISKAN